MSRPAPLLVQVLLERLHADAEPTVLLWQVLTEATQQRRRWRDTGRLAPTDYPRHVAAFRHLFPLVTPTPDAFDAAMSLCDRYSLSHWDGMILGACQAAGVTRLYAGDVGARPRIDAT